MRIFLIATVALLLCPFQQGWAAGTKWQGEPGAIGNWFEAENWTNGVPGGSDSATIENGGTAKITGGEARAQRLEIDSPQGGSVEQLGGVATFEQIWLESWINPTATYRLVGGELFSAYVRVGGSDSANGHFHQSGGTADIERLNVGGYARLLVPAVVGPIEFYPIPDNSEAGLYELSGGQLKTDFAGIGQERNGLFRQTGGTHTSQAITIGTSSLLQAPRNLLGAFGVEEISLPEIVHSVPVRVPSGRYEMVGGTLEVKDLRLAKTGTFHQTGGTVRADLTIGGTFSDLLQHPAVVTGQGKYELIGGELIANKVEIGTNYTDGRFSQLGGIAHISSLDVGGSAGTSGNYVPRDSQSVYELGGGQLVTDTSDVGHGHHGLFQQTGGRHETELLRIGRSDLSRSTYDIVVINGLVPTVVIPPPIRPEHAPQGRYEMDGGRVQANDLRVENTGVMRQTAGLVEVGLLTIDDNTFPSHLSPGISSGRYELLGGALHLDAGLDLLGTLDFGGGNASVTIGPGILNLSRGELLNSQNARVEAGENSLTILRAGGDPAALFGSFHTEGMLHVAGHDLIVGANQGFGGAGTIDDHVIAAGNIKAAEGRSINLKNGLQVHNGGQVDLGQGSLSILNLRSGLDNGSLRTESMTVGQNAYFTLEPVNQGIEEVSPLKFVEFPATEGRFRQDGGEVAVERLTVQVGQYELLDGLFEASVVEVKGRGPSSLAPDRDKEVKADFVQSGGHSRVRVLNISYPDNQLVAYSTANLLPSAYTNLFGYDTVPPSRLSYRMGGGELKADAINIAYASSKGNARFIQTDGRVDVGTLSIQGANGSYSMLGGQLAAGTVRLGSKYESDSGGSFAMLDSRAYVEVNQKLSFGQHSQFTAVPGSVIHMTAPPTVMEDTPWPVLTRDLSGVAASFENFSRSSTDLAGLSSLTMIFEGGADRIATFEVAGEDLGDTLAGFFDNFLLDTLQIGGADASYLRLVNTFDNQLDWLGSEALYVRNLVVNAGSTLDLNGLNIYYLDADIAEGATILGNVLALTAALPGDYNGDGVVDAFDLSHILAHWGQSGEGIEGDMNQDGVVDAFDMAPILTDWGRSTDGGLGGPIVIPEPGAAMLWLIAAGIFMRRRVA